MDKRDIIRWSIPLLIFIIAAFWGYQLLKPPRMLPVYNPSDVDPRLVEPALRTQGRNHRVANYHMVDQFGRDFALKDHQGQVVVANFFFTTCPSICIDMAAQFRLLQDRWKNEAGVVLLSHSVMPEVDTGQTLLNYAKAQGALDGKWYLLTGNPDTLQHIARRQYLAVQLEGESEDDHAFIHTENVILLDAGSRIRGYYNGTDSLDMQRLSDDIALLLSQK